MAESRTLKVQRSRPTTEAIGGASGLCNVKLLILIMVEIPLGGQTTWLSELYKSCNTIRESIAEIRNVLFCSNRTLFFNSWLFYGKIHFLNQIVK